MQTFLSLPSLILCRSTFLLIFVIQTMSAWRMSDDIQITDSKTSTLYTVFTASLNFMIFFWLKFFHYKYIVYYFRLKNKSCILFNMCRQSAVENVAMFCVTQRIFFEDMFPVGHGGLRLRHWIKDRTESPTY